MTRRIKPENRALQDRIAAVLCDAWPEMLTSSQVAELVGGMRTLWEVCTPHNAQLVAWYVENGRDLSLLTCRADRTDSRFPATHHDGPVPQDSWQIPYDAMHMNPPLNRLARDGVVEKVKVQALRAVLWRWAGDRADDLVEDLEAIWSAS